MVSRRLKNRERWIDGVSKAKVMHHYAVQAMWKKKRREENEIKLTERSVPLYEGERAKPLLMETSWLPDGVCQQERGTEKGK